MVRYVPLCRITHICNHCGEEYINESVSAELFSVAKQAEEAGVKVDVRDYLAAM
ncbi:MAG: hypothetical protein LUQ56_03585 [Methylococcaceae bacterium]|nr:hypothetical protein [Methylococcaceae bacterium]